MNYCQVGVSPVFVVHGQPPEVLEPREGSLYNPSFWQGDKFVRLFVRPKHDLQSAVQQLPGRISDGITLYSPSASIRCSLGNLYLMDSNTSSAPTLSWTFAGWIVTDIGCPKESTTMCSFLPLIFLFPSTPSGRQHDGRS